MDEFIAFSRAVAADLAAEFRDDPQGELAAWLRIALEREGMVASLYRSQSAEARFAAIPKRWTRAVLAKVNAICANEESHVNIIRGLFAPQLAWPHVALKESWGRLQGIVLNQLAGASSFGQAMGRVMLRLGARSSQERAAATAVARLDACGFLQLSRTLEVTAVESYERIVTLMSLLRRRRRSPPAVVALQLQLIGILRDERVHRDVFAVLCNTFPATAVPDGAAQATRASAIPKQVAARPLDSPAELNAVCRDILTFHYGAALPRGASPAATLQTALEYWHWQLKHPLRRSFFAESQRRRSAGDSADVLLLGTAGLDDALRGARQFRAHLFDEGVIPWCLAQGPHPLLDRGDHGAQAARPQPRA